MDQREIQQRLRTARRALSTAEDVVETLGLPGGTATTLLLIATAMGELTAIEEALGGEPARRSLDRLGGASMETKDCSGARESRAAWQERIAARPNVSLEDDENLHMALMADVVRAAQEVRRVDRDPKYNFETWMAFSEYSKLIREWKEAIAEPIAKLNEALDALER